MESENLETHITTHKQLDQMAKKYPLAVDDITGLMDYHVIFQVGFTEQDYLNREIILREIISRG